MRLKLHFSRLGFCLLPLFVVLACQPAPTHVEQGATSMAQFIAGMPKAELHLHLEGTLSPQTIVTITKRNGIDYFRSVEEVKKSLADRKPGLMGFLGHHNKSRDVLQTQQDFYDATFNLLKNLKDNNIIYSEIFFDPQPFTNRGIAFDDIINGIDTGRRDGEKTYGITAELIMSINRELSVDSAFAMLDLAYAHRGKILGLGLDSGPEYGNPPIKFKAVYQRAKEQGYHLTGHHDVDVRDSLKHIWQSLDQVALERIDHGLMAVDDPALIKELVRRGICLTGSPVKRATDPRMQDVDRIIYLDAQGVCVSLNSDDPAEFETGYLTNMMVVFQEESGYSRADMVRLMRNAFTASWLPEAEKQNYLIALENYLRTHESGH